MKEKAKNISSFKLNKVFSYTQRIQSFKHAILGLTILFKNEANFKIQLIIGGFVIVSALLLQFNPTEIAIVLLIIGWVLFAEAFNTIIEHLLDFIHPALHPKIKILKDIAAGAVLIIAIFSMMVGFILFIPKILNLF